MVYFDTEEHQIPDESIQLAEIPKLGSQWRVIHDFNPREYLPGTVLVSVGVSMEKSNPRGYVGVGFHPPKIGLGYLSSESNLNRMLVQSTQLPKVGEWTKIEIIHEEENGKFFLSLSVGGQEVGREEVTDLDLRQPTDVKICIGTDGKSPVGFNGGVIRRLVVLEKS